MTNQNDSFIDEVTEDLRRDRLFTAFRRWGWVGALVIAGVVGGAAWREYTIARERAAAEAFGDAILAAQDAPAPAEALDAVDPHNSKQRDALTGLLAAGVEQAQGQSPAARLEGVANDLGASDPLMRDLARLKLVLAQGDAMDPARRDAVLADLARPGAPFELMALEQQAVALAGAGRRDDAVTLIRQIQQKDGLSQDLRQRLSEMMIVLGVEATPGNTGMAAQQ